MAGKNHLKAAIVVLYMLSLSGVHVLFGDTIPAGTKVKVTLSTMDKADESETPGSQK